MKKELAINNLRKALAHAQPVHDTPIGVIHPYWARKPLNIIELVISCLTKKNDTILDPFMGSGTTIFAAANTGRKAIGSDINPLAVFIVQELLKLANDPADSIKTLEKFMITAEQRILPLFLIENTRYAERERYWVDGNFENGDFKLRLTETVTKEFVKGKWSKRKVEHVPKKLNVPLSFKRYLKKPFNFEESLLCYNSRIAIPEGANLSHFFTDTNRISLNILIEISESKIFTAQQQKVCKFLISSCLPLLRLSDKKASSQWPYWRPKIDLTSRNPIMVLNDRFKQIQDAIKWYSVQKVGKAKNRKKRDMKVILYESAIQNLSPHIKQKVKLILTDPPYNDHVPYLEYSAFWNNILGFDVGIKHFRNEIVNSDAPERRKDTNEYLLRLSEALRICSNVIAKDGLIIWFYQDQVLESWKCLYEAAIKNKLFILDVIPIKKQRRSMKTVTSPNKTLDGDLMVIFSKQNMKIKSPIIRKSAQQSYFDKYATMIKKMLMDGSIIMAAKEHKKINQLLK